MMKYSKFEEAYLKVLKESAEDIPADATEVPMGPEEDGTQGTPQGEGSQVKLVTFKTSDPSLIDAINSGFDAAVFTVKSTDENGEETTQEVSFGPEAFEGFEVTDFVEDEMGDEPMPEDEPMEEETEETETEETEETETEESEECEKCGKTPCECDDKESCQECGEA